MFLFRDFFFCKLEVLNITVCFFFTKYEKKNIYDVNILRKLQNLSSWFFIA